MAVLGVYEGHNAGASLISRRTGQVVAAVEEERFSRVKNHDSRPGASPLPVRSIRWCLDRAQQTGETIDVIAIGLMQPDLLQERAWGNFTAAVARGEIQRLRRAAELGLDRDGFTHLPFTTQTRRITRALEAVRAAGMDPATVPHRLYEHHLCHAASFLLAPVERALVVTLDGKGDDLSGSVWQGRGTRLQPVTVIATEWSLGHFYSAATVACGLRPQRDEGKLMALAAHGTLHPGLLAKLRDLISFDAQAGRPTSRMSRGIVQGPYPDRVASFHNEQMAVLIDGIDRADVAHTVQHVLEDVVTRLVQHHLSATGETTIVVSGGVFANVSLNRRLGRLPGVRDLHVHPGMTDSGIALGAAALAYAERCGRRPRPLEDLGLGPAYDADEAVPPFLDIGYRRPTVVEPPHLQLARALARGHVVARFVGGCEYGPRALGHRSVLAPAHNETTLRDLNVRLGRSQIMPFAPIVLSAWAPDLFTDCEALHQPMRFMTTAVTCTDTARREIPAAVHRDGTARPQLVDPRIDPDLADLLTAYRQASGRRGLVNTSFNLHDEPIVCTPRDAARSAAAAHIEVVQVGTDTLTIGAGAEAVSP
ncbi:carbamoyltransferase C-terminal domain-containing protein [Arsenicicoccus bolidensis]|uniref:carbamoyltransferase C-terminal domain-containing protein n=1 Tax=Arsenicicoccus bolidensis TaxID=229480 RepID=UPI0028B02F81|nr:carbamoyltransferase C-terminal domain-containing protein [Arsenicicoccus bolidensis]